MKGTACLDAGDPSLSQIGTGLLVALSRSIAPELAVKVRELSSLEEGWDGEDGSPVRVDVLARAVMLLRLLKQEGSGFTMPFIAPTFDGSVLLDWTGPGRTLEVQTEPAGWSVVGTLTSADGRKQYLSAHCDLTGLGTTKYYEWFRDELLLWPTV